MSSKYVKVVKAEEKAASLEFRAKSSREAKAVANSMTDRRQRGGEKKEKKNPM